MELAHLTYKRGKTYEDYLGLRGLRRLGRGKWRRRRKNCRETKDRSRGRLCRVGRRNVKKLKKLPPGTRLGNNQNAFLGGFRMWANSQSASSLESTRELGRQS